MRAEEEPQKRQLGLKKEDQPRDRRQQYPQRAVTLTFQTGCFHFRPLMKGIPGFRSQTSGVVTSTS